MAQQDMGGLGFLKATDPLGKSSSLLICVVLSVTRSMLSRNHKSDSPEENLWGNEILNEEKKKGN